MVPCVSGIVAFINNDIVQLIFLFSKPKNFVRTTKVHKKIKGLSPDKHLPAHAFHFAGARLCLPACVYKGHDPWHTHSRWQRIVCYFALLIIMSDQRKLCASVTLSNKNVSSLLSIWHTFSLFDTVINAL
jgi:hypothetical protein